MSQSSDIEDYLLDLVHQAAPKTFDWVAMDKAGTGLMGSDVYLMQLRMMRDAWKALLPSLGITDADIQDAVDSGPRPWQQVMDELWYKRDPVLTAISLQMPFLPGIGVELEVAALRTMVIGATAYASFGTLVHESNVARYQVELGARTLENAEDDASSVLMLWDSLIRLYNLGSLDALKLRGLHGLGLTKEATIVIGVLAGIALIGVVLYAYRQQSFAHEFQMKACFKPDGVTRISEPWPPECKSLFEKMDADPWSLIASLLKPVHDLTQGAGIGIGVAIVVAAAIYVGGVYVLPALVERGAVGKGRRLLPAAGG